MRKSHASFRMKLWRIYLEGWYTRHFIFPQFEAVGEGTYIMNPRHIEVNGPGISVGTSTHFMALPSLPIRLNVCPSYAPTGKIVIGDNCVINPGCRITSAAHIEIGSNTMLAMNVNLMDSDWHDLQHRIYPAHTDAPIILKDNVWIGDSATVGKGVTVGENSIVGTGAVVVKDVPPNVIVGGNPARVIRELDVEEGFTTRHEMFHSGDEPYDQKAMRMLQESTAGNTVLGWLRTRLWPTRRD